MLFLTLHLAGVDMFIDLCFGVDMVLSFLTAYIDEDDKKLVYSKRLVVKKYLSGWLAVDLISTAPIDKVT